MTFQLQPPAQIWDEEITTDKWPLPPAKPWEPKSSIEQMCEEALERLAVQLDEACLNAMAEHIVWCSDRGITPAEKVQRLCDWLLFGTLR